MKYPKIPLAQTVVKLCKLKDIKHIVISPGSRNAPLTIGFTSDSFFSCYSIVDERCAAFYALGIAQQLQEPVAVVCTSGSAVLNYYPAVSEAYYSNIPLVVLSADRPKHLINIGDGQTIYQPNVFENHILYSASLKLDLNDENRLSAQEELPLLINIEHKLERLLGLQQNIQDYNEEEINTALDLAVFKSGPVHINIPFDEPLYDRIDQPTVNPELKNLTLKHPKLDENEIDDCVDEWYAAKRKMILVGTLYPKSIDQSILDELADDDSVVVFTETTSNLHHPNFFPSIDKIIAPLDEEAFELLQPDILVTFGGMIVSKKIKAFLRKYKPKQHWHIDTKKAYNTFFSLTRHIEAHPNTFFKEFLAKIEHLTKSDYFDTWIKIKKHRSKMHLKYMEQIPFSDFTVFGKVLKAIPKNTILQLGNSSTVRYAQLFNLLPSLDVFCNRGTSGIDGSTSTAIGSAVVAKKPTTFITGDLSFFYDSNALWNNYIPNSFRIIVINNQGGGIFRILPGHKNTDNFDNYFETIHNLNAKALCEMFNFNYAGVSNDKDLQGALESFFEQSSQPKLLEIFTPRTDNDEILLEYFNFIK